MQELIEKLNNLHYTIASCESCTAGLFAATLANYAGSSSVLRGGLITYQNIAKERLLEIPAELIKEHGVVSETIAKAMVESCAKILAVDVCVSFTGNAGPLCLDNLPAGYICAALITPKKCITYTWQFHGERNSVRQQAIDKMVEMLLIEL